MRLQQDNILKIYIIRFDEKIISEKKDALIAIALGHLFFTGKAFHLKDEKPIHSFKNLCNIAIIEHFQ